MRQLVSYFIVPEDYETNLLAAKGMLKGEMGVATVTLSGKLDGSSP